jgi:UDP-3-O-acyl N-acetylglucosamine deacetylase
MITARRTERTIAREAEVRGVGFIHGCDVALRFRPAPARTGIVFTRVDLPGRPTVRAHINNVVPTPRRTTIRQGAACVEMVEHVLAALAGMRVDNCSIEIDAPETPGCDGSSKAFLEALNAAEIVDLDVPRDVLVIEEPLTLRDETSTLSALPGERFVCALSYHLEYGSDSPIGSQSLSLEVSPGTFAPELAGSRTFLLEEEARELRAAGIGRRTSESDLLIFGRDGLIGNTLRYPDECVRHKMLDLMGDLALLEKDIVGHIVAHRSGHRLNAALVRALSGVAPPQDDLIRSSAADGGHDGPPASGLSLSRRHG